MANQFVNLPALAANGAGAAVDISTFGAIKTIVVQGVWAAPNKAPTVNIEINNDSVPNGSWAPACPSIRGTGIVTFSSAARWMRVRVSGYRGGQAPDVNLGGTDDGADFATLTVPAGNGVGAAVDVTSLGLLKTLVVNNRFSGAIILELCEDAAGVNWAQWSSMQAPGAMTNIAAAYWARLKRVGIPANDPYGTPLATLGGANPTPGGGGGSAVFTTLTVQELRFLPSISPAALAAGATNDYGPAGFSTTTRVRQATNVAGSTLNGLVAQNDGDLRIIENIGTGTLTIANEAGASAAANRFTCPGGTDLVISSGGAVQAIYDGTTARWLLVAAVGTSVTPSFSELTLTPPISPAALAAGTTNDYGPAGLATSSVVRLTTDAGGSTLSGLVAQGDGDIRILENLGPGTLTLTNAGGGSAAANRFALPGASSSIVRAGGAIVVIYDVATTSWRQLAMGSGGAEILNTLLVNTTITSDGELVSYQTKFTGYLARNGGTTPAALAAGETNDYDITAVLIGANRIRQATDAANSALSGMVSIGINGAEWILVNLGPGTLTLEHEDVSSAAANRFSLEGAANRVIGVNGAVIITYDSVLARWLCIG